MKFVGNYNSWIDPKWRELVLSTEGQARPRDWAPAFAVESDEYKTAHDAGYDLTAVHWWVYEQSNLNINITPPWCGNNVHWWITKLLPGQFMPMHTDPHTHGRACNRFWVPLQDYVAGHVFIYDTQLIADYKAGDVFQYVNSIDQHGAANISTLPRVVLQVTEYLE
jgi:hypothetical protein